MATSFDDLFPALTDPWAATVTRTPDPLATYGPAIASIESGGRYDLRGPVTRSGDRAYGRYQVMGANIPEWTEAAGLGRLTPAQFLASREAQDRVFTHRFGRYVERYGPEGAAAAWFAGEGGMNDPGRRDRLGTSVADYVSRFRTALRTPTARPLTTGGINERTPTMADPTPLPTRTRTPVEALFTDPIGSLTRGEASLIGTPLEALFGRPVPAVVNDARLDQRNIEANRTTAAATRESEAIAAVMQHASRVRDQGRSLPPRTILMQVLNEPMVLRALSRVSPNHMIPLMQRIVAISQGTPVDAMEAFTGGATPAAPGPGVAAAPAQTLAPGELTEVPGVTAGPGVTGAAPAAAPAMSPDEQARLNAIAGLDPAQAARVLAGPPPAAPFTLGPGQTRFDPTGRPIAAVPADQDARAIATSRATLFREMAQARPRAESLVTDLETLQELSRRMGTPGWGTALTRFAQERGFPVGTTAEQTFTSIVGRLAPSFREAGSGPLSDADMRLLLGGIGNIAQPLATRQRLLSTLHNAATVRRDNAIAADDYVMGRTSLEVARSAIEANNARFRRESERLLEALRQASEGFIDHPSGGRFRRVE